MNRILMLLLLLASSALATTVLAQEVYRSVGSDGSVQYSDQPSEGSEAITLQPVQGYKPIPTPTFQPSSRSDDDQVETRSYEQIAIVSPSQDDTIRDNQGNIDVAIDIRPALQRGDTIRLLLDGQPVVDTKGPLVKLENLDRGTHTLMAQVVAEDNRVLASSDDITIYLKRNSVR